MKALAGMKMSYRLQQLLFPDLSTPIRGLREEDKNWLSLNAYLYTVLRTNRSQRRGFIQTLLCLFDDSARVQLEELIYTCDNLAFFPFLTQDEPLFIIHQIEVIVSVSGSNLVQSFREVSFIDSVCHKWLRYKIPHGVHMNRHNKSLTEVHRSLDNYLNLIWIKEYWSAIRIWQHEHYDALSASLKTVDRFSLARN